MHFLGTKGSKSDEKVMTNMHKNVLTSFMDGPLPTLIIWFDQTILQPSSKQIDQLKF